MLGLDSSDENCNADVIGEGRVFLLSARFCGLGGGGTSEKSRLGLLTALTSGLVGARITKLDDRLLPRDGALDRCRMSSGMGSKAAGSDVWR